MSSPFSSSSSYASNENATIASTTTGKRVSIGGIANGNDGLSSLNDRQSSSDNDHSQTAENGPPSSEMVLHMLDTLVTAQEPFYADYPSYQEAEALTQSHNHQQQQQQQHSVHQQQAAHQALTRGTIMPPGSLDATTHTPGTTRARRRRALIDRWLTYFYLSIFFYIDHFNGDSWQWRFRGSRGSTMIEFPMSSSCLLFLIRKV